MDSLNKTSFSFKNLNGLKGFVVGFVLSVALVGGVAYAWNAIWHGTDWIQAGNVIESEKVAENFEYLKRQVNKIENIPTCTDEGQALQFDGNKIICSTISTTSSSSGSCGDRITTIVNGNHTVGDCMDAGGVSVDIGNGQCICKMTPSSDNQQAGGNSCPAGWNQYENWSQTENKVCHGGGCGSSCSTGQHAFDDIAQETCRYIARRETGDGCDIVSWNRTCYATILKLGCY